MIKGSLVLTFLLINTISAQDYLNAEDVPSRHDLEMQFLKDSFAPPETLATTEEEITDEVKAQAAAPEKAPVPPQEDDEDFVLPLEEEMFGGKVEKDTKLSRTKKGANKESAHKRRLR